MGRVGFECHVIYLSKSLAGLVCQLRFRGGERCIGVYSYYYYYYYRFSLLILFPLDDLERNLVDYAVELNHLTTQTEAIEARYPNRIPVGSAVPSHASTIFMVVRYGKPLLFRSKAPSMVAPTNIPLYSKIVFSAQYNRIQLTAPFSIAESDLDILTYPSDAEGEIGGLPGVAGWASNKFQVRVMHIKEFAVT